MATMTSPRITAPRTDIMGRSGSTAVCSSEPARGSTDLTTSTATLTTASIHITATLVHIRNVESSPSITSTETKCVMGAVTLLDATASNSVPLQPQSAPIQSTAHLP